MLSTVGKVSSPLRFIDERGMTLIELLIALAIMALAGVALLASLTTGFQGIMASDRSVTKESLAKSEMECVKSMEYTDAPWDYQLPGDPPYWDPGRDISGAYAGYTVQVNANLISGHDSDDGIQQITIIVSHVDTGGRATSFTVSGYKVKRQ